MKFIRLQDIEVEGIQVDILNLIKIFILFILNLFNLKLLMDFAWKDTLRLTS